MSEIKSDLTGKDEKLGNNIHNNISEMLDNYNHVHETLEDFDQQLVRVLEQHEDDFMYAYKMHMVKIEKEL